ncbi:3-oxoacyl-ACP reductase FabG [Geminisphaera colitermitum]|uniref:3-oxoacyl-ACP reductase FabG n=1 Tax=Geminisphaera colitermitum TaxID=1148786 RepID=UPI0005B9175D|nr:3-oxoacyl-ACP reductase FabG [Geminisphaera colitermitum]
MYSSLQDKSVIVTGASKGIGKGIARVFVRHGARVLLVARNETEGRATAAELQDAAPAGGTATFFRADVTRRGEVDAMINEAIRLHGGLDILCANAGAFPALKLADMTDAAWDDLFATNVRSLFTCVQLAAPHLKKSPAPRIVVTSSITGPITGFPGWSHYGATKAAQLGFLRTAAIELARDRITINAVLPGNILTEGLAGLGPDYIAATAACIPLGKLGSVDDIGHAAAFLASAEAGFITGHALVVDGGQILPESPAALTA